jgi:hypothetical protein
VTASAIDAYLDDLLLRLHGEPSAIRRMLTESEDHLRQAAAEGRARGLSTEHAEREAVARFGSVSAVARGFATNQSLAPSSIAIRQAAMALAMLGIIGCIAIGVSGAVAAGMGALWGKAFVSGDADGVTYTAARCADLRSYFPHAGSCEAAAVQHHFEEIVQNRLAVGVFGLLGLGLAALYHRRRRRAGGPLGPSLRLIPRVFVPIAGATVFGGAAALLAADGLNLLIQGLPHGAGGQLSGAFVSAFLAAWFARHLLLSLRRHPLDEPAAPLVPNA